MKKTVRTLVVALLIATPLWALPGIAGAANNPSRVLTITPATTKPVIKPGESIHGSFQVLNQGSEGYPVLVYAAPYAVHSEDYTPDFTPIPGKLNASSWLEFGAAKTSIAANETLDISYTITVPQDAKPGGYYAVAFAETRSPATGQGVVVNERVGEIFYIQVAGPVKQTGKLLTWSSKFLQQQPLIATLRLENDGSLDYASNIHIVIRDLFGQPKYALTTSKEVLPQAIRRIPINWDAAPTLGLFKVTGTITIPGNTQALRTRYVLVASPAARIVSITLAGMLLAYGAGKQIVRHRQRAKAKAA